MAVFFALLCPCLPCSGFPSASGRRFIGAAWAAPLAVFRLLQIVVAPVIRKDAAEADGD